MTAPSEDAYRDLLELETVLDEMTQTQGWQALKAAILRAMEDERRRLLGGQVTSHDEYLKTAWKIRGAEDVFNYPKVIAEHVAEYRRLLAEREGGAEE